jgi:hypothetical protein
LFDDFTVVGLDNFPRFQGTLRALCFADDPRATRPAVELFDPNRSGRKFGPLRQVDLHRSEGRNGSGGPRGT